jgi:hypothetical protein
MKYQFIGLYPNSEQVFHHLITAESEAEAVHQLGLEFDQDLKIIAVAFDGVLRTTTRARSVADLLKAGGIHISEHEIMEHRFASYPLPEG